jgi:hypothetical protein
MSYVTVITLRHAMAALLRCSIPLPHPQENSYILDIAGMALRKGIISRFCNFSLRAS